MHICILSHSVMFDSATPWTVACQAPLSMGFSRQEYWRVLPFLPAVYHVLLELFSMTPLSWLILHSTAHRFIELCKPLHYEKAEIHEEKCLQNGKSGNK